MAKVARSKIDPDVDIITSTWQDNPFLGRDYVKVLEDLLTQDENAYRVYTLGLWGLVQRRIYSNYKVIPELPEMEGARWGYGLDYGLVAPTAIIKVYLIDDKIYAEERLYKTNLTNSDIIAFFSHEAKGDIWADPSAKMMTAEIQRAGYSAFDGHKGVKEGIDLCQRQIIHIPQSSVNLLKEIQSYQWKEDKAGNILNEPVKFNDHALDALRYVVFGLTSRFGFPTQRQTNTQPIRALKFRQYPRR